MEELALLYLRKALGEAMKSGMTTFFDELAEALTAEQLSFLIGILDRVKKRKTTTINAKTG